MVACTTDLFDEVRVMLRHVGVVEVVTYFWGGEEMLTLPNDLEKVSSSLR
jgi:hypothetical protein